MEFFLCYSFNLEIIRDYIYKFHFSIIMFLNLRTTHICLTLTIILHG